MKTKDVIITFKDFNISESLDLVENNDIEIEAKIDEFIKSVTNKNGEIDETLLEQKLNEGVLGAIIGGLTGLTLGVTVGKLIAKILGASKDGMFYKLLTSKTFTTVLGAAIGSKV